MHICLLCHTEADIWDGGFYSIDHVLPRFLEALGSVTDGRGRTPRVAWCLTGDVMRHRAGAFVSLAEGGHEIGVHSHGPDGDMTDDTDDFHAWFPELCSLAAERGLPRLRTNATGMFAYRDGMTRTLAECGIDIDGSVCYGGAHYSDDGFLFADGRRRLSGKPYRLSLHDHCVEGDAPVVELPVSGGFGKYWEPDERGGFGYFSPLASEEDAARQVRLLRARLDDLSPGEIDIFQIHFHLYEFVPPGGFDPERLQRAMALLKAMSQDPRVHFSTPSEAVDAWLRGWEGSRHGGG
jgi:hypothetical protein